MISQFLELFFYTLYIFLHTEYGGGFFLNILISNIHKILSLYFDEVRYFFLIKSRDFGFFC